jgi:MinD-like ATPase involved in chromosome partitioning or flagellar assembly
MREATGRAEPLAPIVPARPVVLRPGSRVGFWSLAAGAGASTVAALVAHRSAAGGEAPLLVDLDRWSPSLALRAGLTAASVADALLQPGREAELVSRWSAVPFLAGARSLHASFDGERVVEMVRACSTGRAAVVDLGAGADALDPALLASLDRLCLVAGTRSAQLQAAFCAVPLLQRAPCAIGLVIVASAQEDATRIAERVGLPLLAAIPHDAYLADDSFAARAPTLRAIDSLLRALA